MKELEKDQPSEKCCSCVNLMWFSKLALCKAGQHERYGNAESCTKYKEIKENDDSDNNTSVY